MDTASNHHIDAAMDAMTPKYKAVLADETIEGFVEKLKQVETTPRAVFIGPAYPLEKQDELERLIAESGILCHVIKTNPPEQRFGDLMEKSKDMPELDRVGWLTRQMFDRAHIE